MFSLRDMHPLLSVSWVCEKLGLPAAVTKQGTRCVADRVWVRLWLQVLFLRPHCLQTWPPCTASWQYCCHRLLYRL
jgi:hypothetical protein